MTIADVTLPAFPATRRPLRLALHPSRYEVQAVEIAKLNAWRGKGVNDRLVAILRPIAAMFARKAA